MTSDASIDAGEKPAGKAWQLARLCDGCAFVGRVATAAD
jgi:hypothetical protein